MYTEYEMCVSLHAVLHATHVNQGTIVKMPTMLESGDEYHVLEDPKLPLRHLLQHPQLKNMDHKACCLHVRRNLRESTNKSV